MDLITLNITNKDMLVNLLVVGIKIIDTSDYSIYSQTLQ